MFGHKVPLKHKIKGLHQCVTVICKHAIRNIFAYFLLALTEFSFFKLKNKIKYFISILHKALTCQYLPTKLHSCRHKF